MGNEMKIKKNKLMEKLSLETTNGNNKFKCKNNMKIMLLMLLDFKLKWEHFPTSKIADGIKDILF